jgi:integrase
VVARALTGSDQAHAATFDWSTLDGHQAQALRDRLADRYAPATVNKILAIVRGVMRACRDRAVIDERQYQAVARIGPAHGYDRDRSRTLTEDEVRRLFEACAQDLTAAGRRNAAVLAVLLGAGLRSEEATELGGEDVDLDRAELHIRATIPSRRRTVPLDPGATAALRDWLATRGDHDGPLLLPIDRGGTLRRRRLTQQALHGICQRIAGQAGVGPVSTRDLRRTCLVRLIASGMPIERIRPRVGHLSWLTTAAYRDMAADQGDLGALAEALPYAPPDAPPNAPPDAPPDAPPRPPAASSAEDTPPD